MNRYIQIDLSIGKRKPNTVNNQTAPCPFCDRETIKKENHTLVENDGCLLIENKYPAFKNNYQTVFIESRTCDEDLSNYSKDELYSVLDFGLNQWLTMSQNPKFQSVVFLKNHGSYSGASIHHPHMQIIGLKDIDYRNGLLIENFEGHTIQKHPYMEWNISTKPLSEFYEFNVSISKEQLKVHQINNDSTTFHAFCDAVQDTTYYILNNLNANFKSYNLVFYEFEDRIIVKIIPRGFGKGVVNSAFLLGYNIAQVPSDLQETADELLKLSNKKRGLP